MIIIQILSSISCAPFTLLFFFVKKNNHLLLDSGAGLGPALVHSRVVTPLVAHTSHPRHANPARHTASIGFELGPFAGACGMGGGGGSMWGSVLVLRLLQKKKSSGPLKFRQQRSQVHFKRLFCFVSNVSSFFLTIFFFK